MCLLIGSRNGSKIPESWFSPANKENPDGIGLAWIEDGLPNYQKGLKVKQALELYKKISGPHFVHFRFASSGVTTPLLNHPFPVSKNVPLRLYGKAEALLAHNGHYNSWKELCLKACISKAIPFPEGPWSDTRAFAWLAGNFGHGLLELLDEKIALLTKDGLKLFKLASWDYDRKNNLWLSNTYWKKSYKKNTSFTVKGFRGKETSLTTTSTVTPTGPFSETGQTNPYKDLGLSEDTVNFLRHLPALPTEQRQGVLKLGDLPIGHAPEEKAAGITSVIPEGQSPSSYLGSFDDF